jgi:hypothetical protein
VAVKIGRINKALKDIVRIWQKKTLPEKNENPSLKYALNFA